MGYIDRIAQQNVSFPIGLAATVQPRRANVARVRVAEGEAMGWRVVLQPIVFQEPFPGSILDFTSGLPNKPQAIVSFGADGVNQEVIVDWPANGGMFSVWGDNVTVDLSIPQTWITGLLPASVSAGASITPDANGGGLRATRTLYTGLLAGGGAFMPAGMRIPPFARSFRWHQQINLSAANAAIPIAWFTTIDAGLAVATQTTPGGQYTSSERTWPDADGITLPPDARFLLFQNNAAAVGDQVSLLVEFALDLG